MRTTVSTKGQVVIPKEIRDRHQLEPGSLLEVEDCGDIIVLRPVSTPRTCSIDDLLALPKYYTGPPVSIEDMGRHTDAEMRRDWQG